MARPYFYYGSTRSYVIAFATILDGLSFKDGWGNVRVLPVHYSPRQKWLEDLQQNTDLDQMDMDITFPRVAFEFLSMQYDPTRNTNALNKIDNVEATDPVTNETYMLNRQPYNFNVKVYLAAVRFNDLLQMIEQIVPFFTPSLTITLNDTDGLGQVTNIPVNLNSVDYNIDYEGSFDNRRVVTATLDFTLKGYQYSNPRTIPRILNVIVNLTAVQYAEQMAALEQGDYTISGPVGETTTITVNENGVTSQNLNTDQIPQGQTNLYEPVIQATAITTIMSPVIVAVSNGQAYIPNLTNSADIANVAGVAITSAASGQPVTIAKQYVLKNSMWSWTPGRVFCTTTGGEFTQTPPTTGAILEVGTATDAHTIAVDLKPVTFILP